MAQNQEPFGLLGSGTEQFSANFFSGSPLSFLHSVKNYRVLKNIIVSIYCRLLNIFSTMMIQVFLGRFALQGFSFHHRFASEPC